MFEVFILSYNSINKLSSWFKKEDFKNTNIYIIDNGKQVIPDNLKDYVIYSTKENIFCAGGWNLCCDIGFKYMNLDKIVITQDDLVFNETILSAAYCNLNRNVLVGATNDYWLYACFGIHKDYFADVGRFDENFFFVNCEDNDYHYRAKLLGKHIIGVYNGTLPNDHSCAKLFESTHVQANRIYLKEKWGKEFSWGSFEYKVPFNGETRPFFREGYWSFFKEQHDKHMSHIEYERFLMEKNKQ